MRQDRRASQSEIELANKMVSPISCGDDEDDEDEDEEEEAEEPKKDENDDDDDEGRSRSGQLLNGIGLQAVGEKYDSLRFVR